MASNDKYDQMSNTISNYFIIPKAELMHSQMKVKLHEVDTGGINIVRFGIAQMFRIDLSFHFHLVCHSISS